MKSREFLVYLLVTASFSFSRNFDLVLMIVRPKHFNIDRNSFPRPAGVKLSD